MTRILITGGAGFIGSHLARLRLRAGDVVHVVVRPETSLHRLHRFVGHLAVHQLHLDDGEALRRCFAEARPAQVFHLAIHTRRAEEAALADALASAREDLLNLLTLMAVAAEADPQPAVVVRTGSLAEYGAGPGPHREGQREAPLTPYTAALTAGAHYAEAVQRRLPFPVVTARLALIYGPNQSEDFFVPLLIRRCLTGEPVTVRHPSDRRDLLYVDDAAEALSRLAATPPPGGGVINISTGVAPRMRDTAAMILAATGADPGLIRFGDPTASSGIPDFRGCPALARELLGWQAQITPEEGINRTVAWFREQRQTAEGSTNRDYNAH